MQSIKTPLINSYSKLNNINNSNSTVNATDVIRRLPDLIPDDGYTGFYLNRMKALGYGRFMELAGKARAGSDSPQKLFCWMLKNNDLVK